jgi:hypothetical protein
MPSLLLGLLSSRVAKTFHQRRETPLGLQALLGQQALLGRNPVVRLAALAARDKRCPAP